jgi:hypothetical protein
MISVVSWFLFFFASESFISLNFILIEPDQQSRFKPAIFLPWAYQAIINKFSSSLSRAQPGLTPSLNSFAFNFPTWPFLIDLFVLRLQT